MCDELVLHVFFEEKSIHSHDGLEDYLCLLNVAMRVRQWYFETSCWYRCSTV